MEVKFENLDPLLCQTCKKEDLLWETSTIHSQLPYSKIQPRYWNNNTGNDRYSGDRFSGIDRFSGTKTPDDAILFTVSGITVIVELFWKKLKWI